MKTIYGGNGFQGNLIRRFILGISTFFVVLCANMAAGQVVPCSSPTLDTDGDGIPDIRDNCILVPNADQRNTTGTPIGNACNTDLNHDGIVNSTDLVLWKIAYTAFNSSTHTYNPNADFNGDGLIDSKDLAILVSYMGKPPGPSAGLAAVHVSNTTMNFGTPFVGIATTMPVTVTNTGCRPVQILSATLVGSGSFQVFPPTSLTLTNPGQTATINVGFLPTSTAAVTATLTLATNAGAGTGSNFAISLLGSGANPTPTQTPTLVVPTSISSPVVQAGGSTTQSLPITNNGTAPLVITGITSNNSAFTVDLSLLGGFPITLAPGASASVPVKVTAGTTAGTLTGTFQIQSNDTLRANTPITLQTQVVPAPAVANNPVTAAQVFDGQTPITAANCASVTRAVTFGTGVNSGDQYQVVLTNAGGKSISSAFFPVPSSPGTQVLTGVNTCSLGDGPIGVSVVYSALGGTAPTFAGTPATQATSTVLSPPTLTPPSAPYFTASTANICGTARASTTVVIKGGTRPVSTVLDASTTTFCLDVPLIPNQQNTLVASAIDNLAPPPRPSESSVPLLVTQVNPSQIVIASATSTPLSVAQIQTLVQNGVISLTDPSNFNVSIFTIVLTIGSFPVTVTQPVITPIGGVAGTGGGGGGGGGGWSYSPPTGGPSVPGQVCSQSCSVIIPIQPPVGPVIPGVLIIDGTIKTLKEFFQVTLAIQNTSSVFTLTNVASSLSLPAGNLTAVSAGVGTNVGTLGGNAASSFSLGAIAPGATGTGQFVIRGDAIGNYNLAVQYKGFITGGGLAAAGVPFNGSANTSVQVMGPPNLSVVVQFPKTGTSYDVVANQKFPLTVNITNTSAQPALYPSLDLFVGGSLTLIDPATLLPVPQELQSLPNINPGQTVTTSFLMRSTAQGYVIACQGLSSSNLSVSVNIQGNQNAACDIANSLPAAFVAPPPNAPPTVLGINPTNGQGALPITTSVLAELTPVSACLVGDTFKNVVTAPIDPNNPNAGIQVTSADIATSGNFYLEELDASGNAVRHVPVQLQSVGDTFNSTTVATLRLGLASPLSQYFLKSKTNYRATLLGADASSPAGAVCNASNQSPLAKTYQWIFQSVFTCVNAVAPTAALGQPLNGSLGQLVTTPIVVNFTSGINGATFKADPVNPLNDSFAVFAGANIVGGDVSGGTLIPGSVSLTNQGKTLTFTPSTNLPYSTTLVVRLTNTLHDLCGLPLGTAASGVQLFTFSTAAAPVTPPAPPAVNPIPTLTNLSAIQVTGTAPGGTTVSITGGAATVVVATGGGGLFSVSVPLSLNVKNSLSVTAIDSANNSSAAVTTDTGGNPLTVTSDQVAPTVTATSPASGASSVPVASSIAVTFSKAINTATANTLNVVLSTGGISVAGSVSASGSGLTFAPSAALKPNTPYLLTLRAGGVSDLAGNTLASAFTASFTTLASNPTIALSPATGVQGQTVAVTITGTNLISPGISVSGTGVTATLLAGGTATSQSASFVIASTAATGAYTVTVTTAGGSATATFTVTGALPTLASLSPATGAQGQTLTVQLAGTNLLNITSISVSGTGVTASVVGVGTATLQSASFVIASTAAVGARNVTVTTSAGSVTLPGAFLVTSSSPTITSLSPATGVQGQTVPVTITGTNLISPTISVSGTGVTATLLAGGTATSQSASFVIASTAVTGPYTVTITTASGSATSTFTVTTPAPTLTSVTPSSGTQGQTLTVQLAGTNLLNITSISVSGTGVTASIIGAGTATLQSASFVIAGTATTGIRNVTVTTSSGSVTLPGAFLVMSNLPTITSLSPATGAQGQTVPVTITGTNLISPSISVSGTGVTATLLGGGSATAQAASFVIASTAVTGPYTVTIATAAGSATSTFTVTTPAPTLTSVTPSSGAQGQTLTVQLAGTNLLNITSISVSGTGVTASIIGAGTATLQSASFVIAGTAATGARNVTVTTSAGSVTLSGAFLVTSGLPTITSLTPASGAQGQTVPVTITGTNLISPTISVSGTGVTATLLAGGTATSQSASFVIASTAVTGAYTVTITTAAGTATSTFTVTTPAPTISALTPAVGEQGRTVTVTITGTNLTSPTIGVSGTGVTATLIGGGSPTSQSATFVIAGTAAAGARTVTVTTASGSATATFTVNVAPPLSVSLTPSPLTLSTQSTTTLTVTLSDLAPTGGQVVNLSTGTGLVSFSPASVTIAQNQTTASVVVASTATAGTDTVTASGPGLTTGTDSVQVQARTFSLNAGLVGLSRTAQGLITLNQPAPSSGATISLSVANTSLVTVSPSSVTIPSGQTTATFTLTGGATIGATTLTADGTASGFTVQTATLTVTNLLLNLSTAQTLGFGQAATYQVQIAPNAAPAGGVVVNLTSSNTTVASVPATVTIPAGAFGVNFAVQAGTTATGTSTISASNANFAPTTTTAAVTAALSLAQTSKTLSSTQTDTVDFQLTSGGIPYNAPAAGVVVAGSSSDGTCVKLTSTSVTVAAGQSFGSLPIAYGTATLPCTATVTLANALYGSASIPVTFQASSNLGTISVSSPSVGVGGGLQTSVTVSLSTAAPPGGVTVEVRSADSSLLLVSPSATALGAPAVNLDFPAGGTSATIYLDGALGATGNVTLSATTPKYTTGSQTIAVLPSVVVLYGPPTSTTPLSGTSGFGAVVGAVYSTSGTTSSMQPQPVNPNTGALMVTASSSKPSVGALKTGTTNAATATATIGVGYWYSNSNSGTGFTFVPLSNGTTTLSVSAPGFGTGTTNYGPSSATVTVTGAGMTVSAGQAVTGVGVGLEVTGSVSLGAPAPAGGATILVTSSDPSQFLLSPDGTTVGTTSINVPIAAGNSSASFFLVGVGTGTTATLSATNAAGYYSAAPAVPVTVVPSVVLLYGPPTSTTPLSGTSGFGALTAAVYSISGTTSNILPQAVSPNTGAVTVTATSSKPSIGALKTGATNGATATATIGVGYTYSNSNSGTGFTFVPVSNGTTALSVSAPGFGTATATNYGYVSASSVTVTVPGMTVNAGQAVTGVGVGLEVTGSVSLGAPAPAGGATILVTSSDPSQFLLSPDGTTVGTTSINVPIAAGNSSASFFLVGVGTGTTATLSATNAAGYYSAAPTVPVTVVPSVVLLYGPPTSTTPLSGTSGFGALTAAVYSISGTTSNILPQAVSPNTGAVTVTATSSKPSIGALKTGATNGATATATIGVGYTYSNSNSGTGFTFVPVSNGTTALSVSAPGFGTATATNYGYVSASSVTVTGAGMTVNAGQAATGVGVGLQTQGSLSLGAPAPAGGATILVTSSDPSQFLLSPDGTTVGTASINVPIVAGGTSASFFLVGVGTGTTATLSATNAAGYYSAAPVVPVTVVPSMVVLYNAPTSTTPLSGTSGFGALVGAVYSVSGTTSNIQPQAVSPNTGAVTVTATSSKPSVGALQTGTTNGATATATIGVGYIYSNSNQGTGFTFVPLSNGTTTLSVSAPGFGTGATNYGPSSTTVTVANAALTFQNGVVVGSGLQTVMTGYLQAANTGGVTIRVASSDATKLLVSPDAVTPGTPFVDIFVNNGVSSYSFYVQGIAGATGPVTLTASTTNTSFTSGTTTVSVVAPQLAFYSGLPTSEPATSADAPFQIAIYVPGYSYEPVAAGNTLVVTVSSSNTAAASLTTSSQTRTSPVTVTIGAGTYTSPSAVSAGGVALHAVGAGQTLINATASGVQSASQVVTLN